LPFVYGHLSFRGSVDAADHVQDSRFPRTGGSGDRYKTLQMSKVTPSPRAPLFFQGIRFFTFMRLTIATVFLSSFRRRMRDSLKDTDPPSNIQYFTEKIIFEILDVTFRH
jgi:hypothetical protein